MGLLVYGNVFLRFGGFIIHLKGGGISLKRSTPTIPETNSLHLKKRPFQVVFQASIFRCKLLGEGNYDAKKKYQMNYFP